VYAVGIIIKGAKIVKVGHSYYFTIPKDLINTGLIKIDEFYTWFISGKFKKKEGAKPPL